MKDWKITWGGNIQYSDYYNNTTDYYNQIEYLTKINFYKYGLFGSVSKSFIDSKLDVSIGIRTDEDNFSTGSKLIDNLSPRVSTSYALTKDRRLKWNSPVLGLILKFQLIQFLVLKILTGNFTNQNAKYTKSNHYVTGFDYSIGNASKISIEGFIKRYFDFPVSILDGVSLANKGADFEVLGNEDIVTIGRR